MSDPDYVRRIIASKDTKAIGRKISASHMANLAFRQRQSERAKARRGAVQSAMTKKSWVKRRQLGQQAFGGYGGNGRPPTKSESVLMALFPEAMRNPAIPTGMGAKSFKHKTGFQHYAKPDLAWLDLKLAVEIDGDCHQKDVQKSRDERKNLVLKKLGWSLLRFSNEDVLSKTTSVQKSILSEISRLRDIKPAHVC